MSRFLALDWDHNQLHLVAASVGGGAVRIHRALVWRETQSPNPAEAQSLGELLRERLREAGIAPAPVLACVGRDRVILKDIRHPAVPEHEEPAVVRFQAIKELTDPPDEVVIDYAPAGEAQGERRALVPVLRRELLGAYQELCRAAGLKLAGLTPRPFGVVACLKKVGEQETRRVEERSVTLAPASPPVTGQDAVAVLAVAERWAEFCVARGDTVLFARALTVGPTLPGEVRRSLAVYAGQAPHPVRAVYVAGGDEHATFRDRLQDSLGIPVYSFDPLTGAERLDLPDGARGAFAGAAGLLYAQAGRRGLPINFAHPKQPRPPRDVNRRLVLAGALVAVLLVAGLFALGFGTLWAQDRQVAALNRSLAELDKRERDLAPDLRVHGELQKWASSEVVWLDELYDLTALFPDPKTAQLKHLSAEENSAGKDNHYAARITLKGNTGFDSRKQVDDFRDRLVQESFYRPGPNEFISPRGPSRQQEFSLKVEAMKRPPAEFKRELEAPPPSKEKPSDRGGRGRKPSGGSKGGEGQE